MILRNAHRKRDFVAIPAVSTVIEKFIARGLMQKEENILSVGAGTSQSALEIIDLIKYRSTEVLNYEHEIVYSDLSSDCLPTLHYKADIRSSTGLRFDKTAALTVFDNLILLSHRVFSC